MPAVVMPVPPPARTEARLDKLLSPPSPAWRGLIPYLGPTVVLLAALLLACFLYACFLEVAPHLWSVPLHDRNAHYDFGLNMAVNIVNGDLSNLRHNLDGARVWGPLHGIVLALILLVGGPSYHLAVLPSLLGWVLSAWLAFLTARRMAPRLGNLAGAAAALLFLVSPAHRAFAADVMLESLGCCLSLLALYAYLRAVQDEDPRACRFLGLALTLLFFLKANYWVLVVAGTLVGDVLRQPRWYVGLTRATVWTPGWGAWCKRQARQPLNYLIVAASVLALAVVVTGGGKWTVLSREISVTSPHNLIHIAYIVLFLRMAWWWRQAGSAGATELNPRFRLLILWHVLPVALYFLLPKRLGYFLWFVSPANNSAMEGTLWNGMQNYWGYAVEHYHLSLLSALAVVALSAFALLRCRSLRPGSFAVLCFLGLAALLACLHPMHKSRFLHSWIAAGWLTAGVGLALLIGNSWLTRRRAAQALAAGVACAGLLWLNAAGLVAAGRAPEGGPAPHRPSSLELSERYLPSLAGCKRTAVISSVPLKFFASWTFLERYPNTRRIETELEGFAANHPDLGQFLDGWLAKTRCDAIVFIELERHSVFAERPWLDFGQLPAKLAQDNRFVVAQRWELPEYQCNVTLWRRE